MDNKKQNSILTICIRNTLIAVIFIFIGYGENSFLFSPFIPYPEEDVVFHTYILSQNGNIVHTWDHDCSAASMPYFNNNDILVRPCEVEYPVIDLPGTGGRIQKLNWLGEILWDFTFSTDSTQQHHDIEILPNGNILLLAWEIKSQTEAINAGKINHTGLLFVDMIVEFEPYGINGGNIVWEWHFWDHLIQDTIPELENYGIISDHPELLDINYAGFAAEGPDPPGSNNPDFTHCNAIHFNTELNQIILTSRRANEIFIIDHSTTTEESKGHTGGNSGKGGDLLYRWGNPANYGRGSEAEKVLFAPHGANWINPEYNGGGNVLIFNNGVNQPGNDFSSIIEIELPINPDGTYYIDSTESYFPNDPIWIFEDGSLFSQYQSGAFRLENGNTLVTVSEDNYIFEVNPEGEIVWDYVNTLGGFVARTINYDMELIFEDINNDGSIDIFDILILVNFILGTSELNINSNNIDFNNDEIVDIFDIIILINAI